MLELFAIPCSTSCGQCGQPELFWYHQNARHLAPSLNMTAYSEDRSTGQIKRLIRLAGIIIISFSFTLIYNVFSNVWTCHRRLRSQEKLPTFYWLPKLHKRPYKARFIANSSSCTTTSLSKVLTSCLTAIKNHWIKYCEKTYERERINYFWSIKNSTEILNKLKTKGFQGSTISTYDFSTLYTTLPHNLIRNQLVDLIENTFRREEALYLACNEEHAFSLPKNIKNMLYGLVKK